MKNLTYYQQLFVGCVLILVATIVGSITHLNILVNIAWVVFGLLFAIHPVAPHNAKNKVQFRQFVRALGVLVILMGLFMKPGL